MATRSRIGIQLSDDSILSAYHHWDGYPEWLGRILKTHYNSKSKASELIDGGDMSSCWTNCGWQNETRPETGPQYYSERGEDCPPSLMTKEEYLDKLRNEEFAYIFRDGEWICYNMNEFNDNDPEIVEIPEGALAA